MNLYEKSLCDCVMHITKTLMMDFQGSSNSIADCIKALQEIDEAALNTLIPDVSQ